ncbi:MAG: ABC transporter permease subunit [Holosporales bacterium]|jgi:putrescine transport system permease protein|nr:ABC transporter permease subunit [Holosporales bacterium]
MKKISKLTLTFFIFGMSFLYIPIFFLMFSSFSESGIPGIWTKFSLKWFQAIFDDSELLKAAITSLNIALFSATGATVLGVLAAVTTSKKEYFIGKKFLVKTIHMPIFMPEIITGFSMLMLFISIEKIMGFSIKRGMMAVSIGHIMAAMSYIHTTIKSRLLDLEKSIEEAAMNLGATPLKVFIYVTIPLISESIFAGWLLAFTLSLDDLVIATFLSGPGTTTLPILIFSNIKIGITPIINAFSTLLICVIFLCLLVTHLLYRKKS